MSVDTQVTEVVEAEIVLAADGLPIMTPTEVRSTRDGLGISRPMLIELTGINGYRCWAAEQESKVDEVDAIEWRKIVSVVLRQVDKDGLPEHLRPKPRKAAAKVIDTRVQDLEIQLALAKQALIEITEAKALKDAKAKATAALEILNAEIEDDNDEVEATESN